MPATYPPTPASPAFREAEGIPKSSRRLARIWSADDTDDAGNDVMQMGMMAMTMSMMIVMMAMRW